jgi:hypothetical protein
VTIACPEKTPNKTQIIWREIRRQGLPKKLLNRLLVTLASVLKRVRCMVIFI